MSIYKDMLNMGLLTDMNVHEWSRREEDKTITPLTVVALNYQGNTIILESEYPYPTSIEGLAECLDKCYLSRIKLESPPADPTAPITDDMGNGIVNFFASENIFYTPDGIYVCETNFDDIHHQQKATQDISKHIRLCGMDYKSTKFLADLGAKKLIDFSPHYDKCKPESLYNRLINLGAKQIGKLDIVNVPRRRNLDSYDVESKLELDGVEYHFKLNKYNPYPFRFVKDDIFDNIKLKHISISKERMKDLFPCIEEPFCIKLDVTKHCILFYNTLFVHPDGWGDSDINSVELSTERNNILDKLRVHGVTPTILKQAEVLGFARLV